MPAFRSTSIERPRATVTAARSLATRCVAVLLLVGAAAGSVTTARGEPTAPTPEAKALGNTVLTAIVSGNPDIRGVALDRVRKGVTGEWFTRQLAEKLPALDPPVQAAVLAALGDRGDAAAIDAVKALAGSSTDPAVRSAALLAIGKLGGAADVAVLVPALATAGGERTAAQRALVILPGGDTPAAIRAAAKDATGGTKAVLVDVLAIRRDRDALPDLVAAVTDPDAAVRGAAGRAVAQLGGPAEVPGLVRGLLAAAAGAGRDEAERVLVQICTASAGKEQSAAAFLDAFQTAVPADRETLLPALGRIGGPAALAIVDGMVADPASRQLGLAALTKWPDATVKDRILDLLAKSSDDGEKKMLLAALIRIAPLPNNKLDDAGKLDLLRKTMALCQRTEDKAKVLERANAIRTIDTFRFVVPYLDDPALAESACRSVVELAHHQKLRDAHKQDFMAALDKVIGITTNEELVERAKRYKAGQTWDRTKKR